MEHWNGTWKNILETDPFIEVDSDSTCEALKTKPNTNSVSEADTLFNINPSNSLCV